MGKKNHSLINRIQFNFGLAIIFIFCFSMVNAQTDDYFDGNFKLGLRLGVNSTSLKLSESLNSENYNSNSKMGMYAGAYFSMPLSEYFMPFVELGFEGLNAAMDYTKTSSNKLHSEAFKGDIFLKYISLGLCPNLVIPVKHVNFNFYGGVHFSFLASAVEKGNYERVYVDTATTQTTTFKTEVDGKSKLITEGFDSGLITGFGFEYKIDNRMAIRADSRFRFGTSIVSNAYKTRTWGVVVGLVYAL